MFLAFERGRAATPGARTRPSNVRRWWLFGGMVLATVVVEGLVVAARKMPLAVVLAVATALLCVPGVVAMRRGFHRAVGAVIAAFPLAPLLVLPTWTLTHPSLHVDNAGAAPIDLWIDGKRWGTVPPTPNGTEPPRLRLPFGTHRLAWSEVGAPMGLHEIEVFLAPIGEHLYAPGLAGCYWVQVTAYGQASTHGTPHGPQPMAPFHRFPRVDVWLGDTPRTVDVPRLARGTTRVAVQRWQQCMELAALGCSEHVRQSFLECSRAVDGRKGPTDCHDEALRACRPSEAKTASTTKP